MHIPDGYLSPSTCGTLGAAMVPFWATAGRRVRKVVKSRYVPYVALGASFSFIVMMFNIPVPDGTTAHGVAGTLTAILLGPWAALIAVSVALIIQALFFGDGGVLAIGANCFNMALVLPFVGYAVYRLLSRNMTLTNPRRALAAGIGGYVGLNVAAMCAAIEFGIQPDLFKAADGTPLYAPFHLSQTIPAMALAHLTVAGLAEFALTFGVIAFLQRANIPILRINHPDVQVDGVLPDRRPLGWRWAVRRAWCAGGADPTRSARARWSVRRGHTGQSRSRQVQPEGRTHRVSPVGARSGTTPCWAATASTAASTRTSATCCRPSSDWR